MTEINDLLLILKREYRYMEVKGKKVENAAKRTKIKDLAMNGDQSEI